MLNTTRFARINSSLRSILGLRPRARTVPFLNTKLFHSEVLEFILKASGDHIESFFDCSVLEAPPAKVAQSETWTSIFLQVPACKPNISFCGPRRGITPKISGSAWRVWDPREMCYFKEPQGETRPFAVPPSGRLPGGIPGMPGHFWEMATGRPVPPGSQDPLGDPALSGKPW